MNAIVFGRGSASCSDATSFYYAGMCDIFPRIGPANVVVVNIDVGFKGGYVAALIARRAHSAACGLAADAKPQAADSGQGFVIRHSSRDCYAPPSSLR